MQLWGDRLLPRALGFSHWESSENDTEAAVEQIPREVVICDWHYHVMENYPSVQFLLERGFRVWPSGWKEPAAIRRLLEVSRRHETDRMLGYLATTWCPVSEVVAGLTGDQDDFDTSYVPDVVVGVRLGAALAQD
jgi:hypothetical protein